jgi:diguanylate cyclase (GGDEF)-like protein
MPTRPIELGLNRGLTAAGDADAVVLVQLIDPLLGSIAAWSAEPGAPRTADFGTRLERLRKGLAAEGMTRQDVTATLEQVVQLCDSYFTETRTLLTEREKELGSLVQVLRDTLADLAGQAKTFHVDLMQTTDRISGLANIDDIRELKRRIASEAKELKNVVVEKQRRDDVLFMQLSRRVDALQSQLAEAQREAEEDALTGVMNRRGFDRTLNEWAAIARRTKKPFLLAMVEVDDFKAISDAHGHQVGDRVLLCVSQRLGADAAKDDVVTRFEGESFAILMRSTDIDEASVRLKATIQAIASLEYEYETAGQAATLAFTCCGGVTEFNPNESAEDFLRRADRALADAKHSGRSQVVARKRGRFGFLNWAS